VAVTETGGKMTLTGDGTDIWNASDDFIYAYKSLNGDGVSPGYQHRPGPIPGPSPADDCDSPMAARCLP
jgi:hypothetical protein